MAQNKEETIWGKYLFSEAEKKEIASELTIKITEKHRVEDEKKSVSSAFKAQLDGIDAVVNKLSENYQNGYEFKNILCTVEFNFETKMKNYRRKDDGEFIEQRAMEEEDFQIKMDMPEIPGQAGTEDTVIL